jgi:hypothetical protein
MNNKNTKIYFLNSCSYRLNTVVSPQCKQLTIPYEIFTFEKQNNSKLSCSDLCVHEINIILNYKVIFKKFLEDGYPYGIFSEDDIIFKELDILGLIHKYNQNEKFSDRVLYYGCCLFQCSMKNNEIAPTILQKNYTVVPTKPRFGTSLFITTPEVIKIFLDNLSFDYPIDNFMQRQAKQFNIHCYYFDPFLGYELSSRYFEFLYDEKIKGIDIFKVNRKVNWLYFDYEDTKTGTTKTFRRACAKYNKVISNVYYENDESFLFLSNKDGHVKKLILLTDRCGDNVENIRFG